jgi:hypothetical protein
MYNKDDKVIVKSQPVDFKQHCRTGVVLGKVAFENNYYRVKLDINGMILVVNDSMMEGVK